MHCTCNIVLAYEFHHSSSTIKSKVVAAHTVKVYEGVKVELHSLVTLAQEGEEYSIGTNTYGLCQWQARRDTQFKKLYSIKSDEEQ